MNHNRITLATLQQWFSVGIFPLWLLFGFEPPFAARQEIARNPHLRVSANVMGKVVGVLQKEN